MTIAGHVGVRCPACERDHEVALVQSINTRHAPQHKAALLAGTLNVLECECGKRTQLEAMLSFYDPDREVFIVAAPGGEDAMRTGEVAFQAMGDIGTRRLVPSRNAMVEKVKILEAGLDDRVVEVLKVLLLAGKHLDINRVLLFERVDRAAGVIDWLLLDDKQVLSSPLGAYEKLAMTLKASDALRIDRAWAVEAARTMMTNVN